MATPWKFVRVPSGDDEADKTATLRVRSSAVGRRKETSSFWCEACWDNGHEEGYPVLLIPFKFSNTSSVENGCESLIASFLEFTLDEISHCWCPNTANAGHSSEDELQSPLVDIIAKVPSVPGSEYGGSAASPASTNTSRFRASPTPTLHRASTCGVLSRSADLSPGSSEETGGRERQLVSRAKRRLLRRSVAAMKSQDIKDFAHERLTGVEYENYDIVTDEHLFDVLELFSTCHSNTAKLNIIDVSTCLYPTVCYRHDDSFKFHLASMKSRSRHFIDLTLGRFHRAIETLRSIPKNVSSDHHSDENSSGRNSEVGFFHRHWIQLTEALKLPEIKRLLRTGLYSPQYVERQLTEVWDNLSNSISRGFEVPF
eukprot:Gregarina_sp_Pseudo_9__2877@NODE_30_length_5561_cov_33_730351_g28_i0_p4_GENE_NODE_30_length_5561_cov_33_730351_g28_i0NODE_30_length_5561_cov_33_730351_g28_i0_p4_ORF_typecomplete_len371_score109_17_NODE_30_length_5561_cov_33_730351_g28_i021423254